MAIVSPCIGICSLDPATGFCRGCRRTLEEIARWMSMDDSQRLAVLAALRERAASALSTPPPRPPTTTTP